MGNISNGNGQEPKSFEQLFEEMNDLLDFVIQKIESPDPELVKKFDQVPADLGQKFAKLENDVNAFIQLNAETIEKESALGKINATGSLDHLTKRELKCLERSKKLVKKAEEIQKTIPKEPLPISTKVQDAEKDHKKHFKRIRRGQTWKL